MYYNKPDKPLNEEFVQNEIDQIEGRKPRDIAEMIVEMRLQLALHENNADWPDGLAMLLRDEPDRYHVVKAGYEDECTPPDVHRPMSPSNNRRKLTH